VDIKKKLRVAKDAMKKKLKKKKCDPPTGGIKKTAIRRCRSKVAGESGKHFWEKTQTKKIGGQLAPVRGGCSLGGRVLSARSIGTKKVVVSRKGA